MSETLRFLIVAVVWTAVLFAMAAAFTGCSVEGAGFTNNERQAKPVVCRETRPGYIQCRSDRK